MAAQTKTVRYAIACVVAVAIVLLTIFVLSRRDAADDSATVARKRSQEIAATPTNAPTVEPVSIEANAVTSATADQTSHVATNDVVNPAASPLDGLPIVPLEKLTPEESASLPQETDVFTVEESIVFEVPNIGDSG